MNLGPELWLAEPETLSDAGKSTFPRLGVSDMGKLIEFAAAVFWNLELDFLGLYEGLDSLSKCTHGLGIVGLHIHQPLPVVLLGKAHVPQQLRVQSLKRFIYL